MKNTKELFIRLYTETLYSNFIVPLRGSNYIQLLYGGFKEGLGFLFKQTRQLVWQGHINEVGQKLYENWVGFKAKIGVNRGKSGRILIILEAKNVTDVSPKCHQKTKVSKLGVGAKKFHQSFINFSPKKYHQMTTEIPPAMTAVDGKRWQFQPGEIGSIRVKSGRKISLKCDQMIPNATRNNPLTYHHLILLNSSFMLCC